MSGKEEEPPPDRWSAAIQSSRDTAKWIATALGVVAAAIFGGIPALKGLSFKWGDPSDNGQTTLAVVAALVGLGGIITVILMLARASLPIYVNLSSLSLKTLRQIKDAPAGTYLPGNVASVVALQLALRKYEAGVPGLQKQLRDAPEDAKDAAERALQKGIANRDTLREWAQFIRQLDVFNRTQRRLNNPALWTAVGAATVGAVAFMFITGAPAAQKTSAEEESIGQVALLTPLDSQAWSEVTSAADIESCANADGKYLVLVRAFAADVYTVQTLPFEEGCRSWQLDVRPEIAEVNVLVEPLTLEVEYLPASSRSISDIRLIDDLLPA